ncbi:MAG: hypothetical protein EZS28_051087, partial [Streblomastix strix]
ERCNDDDAERGKKLSGRR